MIFFLISFSFSVTRDRMVRSGLPFNSHIINLCSQNSTREINIDRFPFGKHLNAGYPRLTMAIAGLFSATKREMHLGAHIIQVFSYPGRGFLLSFYASIPFSYSSFQSVKKYKAFHVGHNSNIIRGRCQHYSQSKSPSKSGLALSDIIKNRRNPVPPISVLFRSGADGQTAIISFSLVAINRSILSL